MLLVAASLAGFLLRQPLSIAVKAISGRRPRQELTPALLWAGFYALILLAALAGLISLGFAKLLWLGLPGVPVFAWHLALIARRGERGQMGIDLVGAGVLALAAPAAYWVSGGQLALEALLLWTVTWLQAAGAITHVFLSLKWRKLQQPPQGAQRWRDASRSLLYNAFNLALIVLLAAYNLVPRLLIAAFLLMVADNLVSGFRPPVGVSPVRIGLRQLAVSSLAVILIAAGYSV